MSHKSINQFLQQYSIPIKEILIEDGLIEDVQNLLNNLGFKNKNILLVSDDNLKEMASRIGNNVKNNNINTLLLNNPKADEENVELIHQESTNINLIIAAGSGTINDLCKITSFRKNIPYIIFASAPSMNGYASANASITINGHKKTLLAHQPCAIYFDLDFLTKAPSLLIKAGIGDILCHPTCHFDWLLSHLILGTKFNQKVFDLLKPYQDKLLNFSGYNLNDKEFIKLLCEILIISGCMMYLCGGSYPASQGEHLISHFLEMKYPQILKNHFHGKQIAVTTLTMLNLQEKFLNLRKVKLKKQNIDLKHLVDLFDQDLILANECLSEIKQKLIDQETLKKVNDKLGHIQNELSKVFISKDKILKIYEKFDLPQKSQDIDIDKKSYDQAVNNSYLIRSRFTTLDLNI